MSNNLNQEDLMCLIQSDAYQDNKDTDHEAMCRIVELGFENLYPSDDRNKNPEGYYKWCTVGDDRVRDSHAERENSVFSWKSPPEGGHPGEDFGCRCIAEPYNPPTQQIEENIEEIESPVENPKIRVDTDGNGNFNAPRGNRVHNGVDIEAPAGTKIEAPVVGMVVRIGNPYRDDQLRSHEVDYKLIVIQDYKGNKHELFYVEPIVKMGDKVKVGDVIGKAQSLEAQYPRRGYPNMKNHIHLQIRDAAGQIINPTILYKKAIPELSL